MRERPTVGLAGVRQIDEERCHGSDDAAIPECHPLALREPRRRTTSVPRLVARGTGARRRALRPRDRLRLDSGSFMLARRTAIDDVGGMDERFFLYCEETDFCLRMRQAGWEVVHLPQMTILHQSSPTGSDETLSRQMAFARRQYMAKHFAPAHRVARGSRSASGTRSAPSGPAAVRSPPEAPPRALRSRRWSGSRRLRSAIRRRGSAQKSQR